MTFFDITYPELPIRKSVFNISEKNIKKLESEGISIESLFTSTDRFKDIILSDQVSQFSEMEERLTKSNELLDSVINGLSDLGSIKTKKIQKSKNQLFTALFDERKTLLEELSKGNASYKQLKKVKSSLFDETYIQERNKYIIGMVAELHLSTNWFHQHPEYYSNHRIITIISS